MVPDRSLPEQAWISAMLAVASQGGRSVRKEPSAFTKLIERVRELDELKAQF